MKYRVLVGSEVIVFLLNHKNQVLLQKRSKLEKHNHNKCLYVQVMLKNMILI